MDKKKFAAVLVFICMILFMSFVCINMIVLKYEQRLENEYLASNSELNGVKKIDSLINISSIDWNMIDINNRTDLSSMCLNGCYLSSYYNNNNYYFIFKLVKENYVFSLMKNNKLIISDKNLGYDIDSLYIQTFNNSILIFNIVKDDLYKYDYAIFVDGENLDQISSLDANEMEFDNNYVTYYYDTCSKDEFYNAKKIKVKRKPFDNKVTLIDEELTNYKWCY